ncbi:MAG: lipid-A-disaccharide synthase [Candidatus Schekmanbacteria bacterium RIFCSPHIGHO2_02_FULL_38_11]|uniref:Lipid-A-disaccharide synthase n=1 Tax=Candidatus Schekmanbacteria bacterium RIFCSPLOWO2_12_FULL_38_15 TaxID=1817883 RepID=A0A1F7SL40_9BACT|nr:MAG: lipid-A-disaccharide synthase [Candidatus Schekmanbacteria bacterium GWA2_38_9]OGL48030.1 MAG: lipid-A-disaccharide synthase [Candidatus Schekmanbacteria bacterium RIFCSPLOWO2_02_FULL_38_14]OGL50695.1 MAG: lipid-A-disaccharide synthase [Candidatus Schekmanbacteria bacterium RIFCSPHIGHO2_02_FULL_38_11]OGL54485.1 MAG: lipid-A-disaccharide synthase [Candidatus Schekmanbacteria bacterium RIFCSPLOWO2_12_FULL_38_15]
MNPSSKNKTLLIIVGDKSADLYGAKLVHELKKIDSSINIVGTGGEKMREEGVKILYDVKDMSVIGLWEAVSKVSLIRKIKRDILKLLDTNTINAAVLLDFPGFNLHIAAEIRGRNIPVIYYISPQIWAWGSGRIKKIKKRVNKMLVILPFEVDIYRNAGVDVRFIGHPLFDVINADSDKELICSQLGLNPSSPIIGILPGSRNKEVRFLLPSMMDGALLIREKISDAQFILPRAKEVDESYVKKIISGKGVEVKVVDGNSHEVMRVSDISIICSGTATLEAAILGSPMLIVYRLSKITEIIGRRMLKIKQWGLVNIMAGKEIVPELEQEEVNGENLSAYVISVLKSEKKRKSIERKLSEIASSLGGSGASMIAAKEIAEFLN